MKAINIFNLFLMFLLIIGFLQSTWLHTSLVLFPENNISGYSFFGIRLFVIFIFISVMDEIYSKTDDSMDKRTGVSSKVFTFEDYPKWVKNLLRIIYVLGSINCFFCLYRATSPILLDIEPGSILGDSQYWRARMTTGAFMMFYGAATVIAYSYFLTYARRHK